MSKLKNPRAKKAASLQKDRRTVGGEKRKVSRKEIPRAKARTHREERRATHQAVADPTDLQTELGLERAENKVTKAKRDAKSRGFRKEPDVPLADALESKGRRRKA